MKDEIELKLDMAPDALQRLRRHPLVKAHRQGRAVTRSLDNTYYDTPEFSLVEAGASLRVRTIGRQRLQTVKLRNRSSGASGHFDRAEWEEPLSSATPDADSLAGTPLPDLLGVDGLATLAPVFTTRFRRTTYVLAKPPQAEASGWEIELTLDHGAVEAADRCAPILEAELELRHGQPADLYRLARGLSDGLPVRLGTRSKADRGYDLIRTPAPPALKAPTPPLRKSMTAVTAFRVIGRTCLGHFLTAEAALYKDAAPEAVHQMRVALRRLRSAMTLFAPLTNTAEGLRLTAEVKWLAGALGRARDLDVFLADVLAPARSAMADAPALAALAAQVERARSRAYAHALAAVGSARAGALLLDLALWLEDETWPDDGPATLPCRDFARRILDDAAEKVLRKGRTFNRLDAENRHRLRIKAKKLRYAVDFFGPLFKGRRVAPYRKALADLQDALGGLNDLVVAQGLLADIAAGAGAMHGPASRDVIFAAGMVSGWHGTANAGRSAETKAAWSRFLKAKPFWT